MLTRKRDYVEHQSKAATRTVHADGYYSKTTSKVDCNCKYFLKLVSTTFYCQNWFPLVGCFGFEVGKEVSRSKRRLSVQEYEDRALLNFHIHSPQRNNNNRLDGILTVETSAWYAFFSSILFVAKEAQFGAPEMTKYNP